MDLKEVDDGRMASPKIIEMVPLMLKRGGIPVLKPDPE